MAAKSVKIKLKSDASTHFYVTFKNKTNNPNRIELKKYDPLVRKHVNYKEAK